MDPATTTVQAVAQPGFDPVISVLFGYLNMFAGVMIIISLIFFVVGYVYFIARMGLDSVTVGFTYMRYGVVVLFTLVLMLGIVHYIQYNTEVVLTLLSIIATIWLLFAILNALTTPSEGEDKKKK